MLEGIIMRLSRVVAPGYPHHVTQRGIPVTQYFCVTGIEGLLVAKRDGGLVNSQKDLKAGETKLFGCTTLQQKGGFPGDSAFLLF
jgi:hypothetical protein